MIPSFTQCICFILLCCFAVTPNVTAAGKVVKDVEFAVVQEQYMNAAVFQSHQTTVIAKEIVLTVQMFVVEMM